MTRPGRLLFELMVGLLVGEDWAELVPGLVLDFVQLLELVEDLFYWFVFGSRSLFSWLFIMV